jgi:hypothetical protein
MSCELKLETPMLWAVSAGPHHNHTTSYLGQASINKRLHRLQCTDVRTDRCMHRHTPHVSCSGTLARSELPLASFSTPAG